MAFLPGDRSDSALHDQGWSLEDGEREWVSFNKDSSEIITNSQTLGIQRHTFKLLIITGMSYAVYLLIQVSDPPLVGYSLLMTPATLCLSPLVLLALSTAL